MITIEKVTKFYGRKRSLDEVSLEIDRGEIFGLIGPNGAGKTTLLSMLATLLKPDSGNIIINHYSLPKQRKHVRDIIGYVPQDVALWEHLTVKDNMLFWNGLSGRKASEETLKGLCGKVQLFDKWNEKVENLSGGMKRKLNMAVALIHEPDILLMDEPTVGIDIQSKLEINSFIKSMATQGKTIVYITHDMNEILHFCTRIGVLNNGRLLFSGKVADLREQNSELLGEIDFELSGKTDEQLIYDLLSGK